VSAPTLFDDLDGLPAVLQTPGRGGSSTDGPSVGEVPAAATRSNNAPALTVIAHGQPIPQGSKRAMHHKQSGKVIMLEANAKTGSWRETVTWAVARAMDLAGQTEPLTGPIRVAVVAALSAPGMHMRVWQVNP
jgi:hypothetical protein